MITLKTLPQATTQDVFDQAAGHLLNQMQKSQTWETCMYRSPNGLKCAAGCFISDDEYDNQLETKQWRSLADQGRVPKKHADIISKLQVIHDHEFVNHWRKQLRKLAEQYELEFKF